MAEVVTVRVPKEVKEEMEVYEINWSDVIRNAIKQKILEAKRKKAFQEIENIREKLKGKDYGAAEKVFEWRKKH